MPHTAIMHHPAISAQNETDRRDDIGFILNKQDPLGQTPLPADAIFSGTISATAWQVKGIEGRINNKPDSRDERGMIAGQIKG
jgi:hypothetical protein